MAARAAGVRSPEKAEERPSKHNGCLAFARVSAPSANEASSRRTEATSDGSSLAPAEAAYKAWSNPSVPSACLQVHGPVRDVGAPAAVDATMSRARSEAASRRVDPNKITRIFLAPKRRRAERKDGLPCRGVVRAEGTKRNTVRRR